MLIICLFEMLRARVTFLAIAVVLSVLIEAAVVSMRAVSILSKQCNLLR